MIPTPAAIPMHKVGRRLSNIRAFNCLLRCDAIRGATSCRHHESGLRKNTTLSLRTQKMMGSLALELSHQRLYDCSSGVNWNLARLWRVSVCNNGDFRAARESHA